MNAPEEEFALTGGGRTAVHRQGQVVIRETGPWAPAVHALLRHLEAVGFAGAPRVVGSGLDAAGRETLTYIDGTFLQPGPWSLEGAATVGHLLRALHDATASFQPPPHALWRAWFGRDLGGPTRVIGHCDVAPWNIVARDGRAVALIDWEAAGPVDPLIELAQACWLNAKLHDDIVVAREGLPPLADRARQLRAIVDAYGLAANRRRGFVDRIIEFVVHDTAEQADEAGVTPDSTDPTPLWGLAWRARAAAWLLRNRGTLQNALS
jgi:Phosphotransferase enzyme family